MRTTRTILTTTQLTRTLYTFHYVDYGEVDHDGLDDVTEIPGLKSHYYFDGFAGRRKNASTLTMGELSHFCAACFAGNLPACDGTTAEYTFHELHCATKKTVAGVGLAREAQVAREARARKLLEARARKLLRNGRNAGARAGDWVMIHIRDVYNERDFEKVSEDERPSLYATLRVRRDPSFTRTLHPLG